MELYLMGLVGPEKVPASFRLLTQATFGEAPNLERAVIEASGIKDISFADIQKRHGVARSHLAFRASADTFAISKPSFRRMARSA